ncbi:MAG: LysR family transcriptional regulator [Steroidobacteraceae bacterium]
MDLRQLRYFQAVAEELNFSRAAERLHVSQPPLSTQIKALEAGLGVALFNRSNRGVTLTPAGAVFQAEVAALLLRVEQARVKARNAGRGEAGVLSVGFVSIADYGVLPPALKQYRARYPQVEVQLHELTTDTQIREIRAGRLDLGIGLAPVAEPDLEFRAVLHEKLVIAAPVGHLLTRGRGPLALKVLANAGFIIPPRDVAPGLYDQIVRLCHEHGFTPRIDQHARQMQTVISLVASGMGFALVPESVRNLQRTGVHYRSIRGVGASIELGTLQQRDSENLARDHFVAVLKSVAAPHGESKTYR